MPVHKKDVFVFNTAENKNRKEQSNKLIALNKVIREKLTDVTKCVLYSTDVDAPKIAQIPAQQGRDYAIIELYDSSNNKRDFDLKIKMTQGTLTLNKYKVLAYKIFNGEYPVCKMVVKLI